MADKSKYLNGLFVTRKEGNFGEEIHIGITDEGLQALTNLPKNGDFRNFTLSPHKNNNNKFSAKPAFVKKSGDDSSGLPF